MTKYFLICIFAFSFHPNKPANVNQHLVGNDHQQDSIEYIRQVRLLIQQILGKFFNDKTVLASHPVILNKDNCLDNILLDSALVSPDENDLLKKMVANPIVSNWTSNIFPDYRIVNSDTIRNIFEKYHSDGWEYFHAHIGFMIYYLSCPIFFRNYTYCIFYSSSGCDLLCGGGALCLYKKVDDKWIVIRSYCNWIS